MPIISKGDQTIIIATDLVKALQAIVPTSGKNKCKHAQYLKCLTIMANLGGWTLVHKQGWKLNHQT